MSDGSGTDNAKMSGRNRLGNETSPYLLQHKDNPVDWYPWGDEAFRVAKERDVPIFLSIGYSTCHWCHVMAHESFSDEQTAQVMNERFVNIKVDREERPDVDAIYMQATQALGNQGGWPLNIFMTPDGKPFFGGTYWPLHDRQGIPGFQRIIGTMATMWKNDRQKLVDGGEQVATYLRQSARVVPQPGQVDAALSEKAFIAMYRQFDKEWGGFNGAPKFPQPSTLTFLLRHHVRAGEGMALRMIETTLNGMADGGIHDQLGGGFSRYSVDEKWHVPHFEKMLYDNAQLLHVYTDAWVLTGDPYYREVASGIVTWLQREMVVDGGGFAAGLDADSEGVEGKFYIWSAAEVDALLEPDVAELVKTHFGISDPGSFEGKTVLSVAQSIEELAADRAADVEEVRQRITAAKAKMLEARSQRIPPGRDDKVIAAWNGLMIHALAHAGLVFDEPDWTGLATDAATFVLERMRNADGGLTRTCRDGETRGNGVLEDYAAMAYGLAELYAATAAIRWLDAGRELLDYAREHFRHDTGVGFYDTPDSTTDLVARPREMSDGALPSGNALMAEVLLIYGTYGYDATLTDEGAAILRSMVRPIEDYPLFTGFLLAAAQRIIEPPKELVFAGDPGSDAVQELRKTALAIYDPTRVIGYSGTAGEHADRYPMLADRPLVGDAAAYVCSEGTCRPAVTTADALAEMLKA
ncbi:MAG TPA: thioredoxin domain-containing protein [Thermomicrobiales bacterium]|nr:thioredoxin domain-containing protein [Thermomicrobiales bacterium]